MKNIDTEKLIRAYNRLPEVYKKILQFKALFLAENKNEFLNCIRSAGIKTESDKVFTHSHLKMVFSIFENEGLLEDGKFLNLALRHYIAKETVQDQSYEKRIIEEDQLLNVEKVIKHDSTADIIKNYNNKRVEAMPEHFFLRYDFVKKQETVFSQSLYLAVYENNSNFFKKYFIADEEGETDDKNDIDSSFQDIAKKMSGMSYAPKSKKIIDLFNTFIKLFNNADFDDDKWFEERNNYIKLLFSFTKFSSIMGLTRIRQANFGYWLDLYKNNEGLHQIYLDKVIVNYFVDLDLALGIFSKKKYEKMYGEEAETLFISGIEKFINGNFAEAKSSLINTMNKQRKKEGAGFTNKSIAVKFLILIYLSDSKTMRKAKTEINKLRRNFDDLYKEINYWDILLELQEGNYQYAKNYFFNLKLSVSELKDDIGNLLLYIILEYLLNEERVKKSLSQYVGKFKVYRDEGLVLHAHIMAELILKFQDNNNCRHFLENVTPYKKLRFLSLFRKKDFWEYKFEILTKLISDKKKTDKSSTVEQNRVIWKLDVDELFITPVEQKVLKNGNWSKGKRIALSRLYNKDSKLVYFTEEDWKIARCVKKYSGGYYHNAEYSFNHSDALEAMIGHSLVFNEDNGLNIEIVKGNIEVIIKENKDGYKITLSNYHYKPEPILVRETETRYKLINFDDNAVEAADLLTKKGLNVPLEKKEQIEEIQKNLKGKYALRSNIENIDLPTLNPSTCMILHFIPINRGLKINLWVRPFDNKGPYLRPGHGEKIQTFLSEGNNNKKLGTRYKVIRNLKEERKNADTVIENIQVLQETNANNDEWIFEDLQDCLELLEQVKKYKEEHSLLIEWPKGESLNLKQTVSYKNMSLKLRTKNDWFEFDGDIKLDDGGIVKLKYLLDNFNSPEGRFIKLSEGKFLGLTEKFRKHIEELKFVAEKNKVHKLGSRVLQNFQNEGAKTEVDKQWTEHIEKLNKLEKHNPRIPGTLAADLRDYQKDGYKFLSRLAHWGVGGCLADDMGLGKTVQSIALLLEKAKHGPSLVVAPTSVCFTWIDE
ncbi:MAG: hypothetical protein K9L78_04665, partial [Victivallales bacterium]|nr:hypothetical protein [Victivallales bacterium]